MKKVINIVLFSLLPLISFAQEQRAGRFDNDEIKENVTAGPAAGEITAPINQYEIALIIMAVSIIAYFVYRQYAKKQA